MIEQQLEDGGTHLVYDPAAYSGDPLRLFDPARQQDAELAPTVSGSVCFFDIDGGEFALKDYRRRGLVARVLHNEYFWRPPRRSRMWREFALLAELRGLGLPVPLPVAALCRFRRAWSYTGQLVTQRLSGAVNLRTRLQERPVTVSEWAAIGRTIARFHTHGVYHDDLNASNIVQLPDGSIYLLDFDKCAIRTGDKGQWKEANLQRLLRSFTKLKGQLDEFDFDEAGWQALVGGYRE